MPLFGIARASLACSLLIVPWLATGAQTLRLEDAVVRALERNPDLAAFAYELKTREGRAQQASARPAMELALLVENALGSGSRSDFDAAETTLTLGFLFEHGARERRQEVARAGARMLDTDLVLRRTDIAAEVARRFIAVLEGQQQMVELQHARELAQQALEAVRSRVRAAKVPQAEEARAQAQLARAKLDEEHAEHQLLTARRKLASLWGDTESTFQEASGDLTQLPALPTLESLRADLAKNPDFERFASEQRWRETELRLAEMRRRPAWQVTTGIRRFEESDDHALIVGLSVPLQSRDYARGAIVEARAQLDQVAARRTAHRVQLDTELFSIYQELVHAYKEVAMLRDEVVPKMEQAEEESRYAYERGRYSYVEWAAAQRELLDMRRSLSSAQASVHRYRVELERLIGASLQPRTSR